MATVFQIYRDVLSGNLWEILFSLSIVFTLCISNRQTQIKGKYQVIIVALLIVICCGNDLSYKILTHFETAETYYRFFWMVPIIPIIAYMIVEMLDMTNKKWIKGISVIIVAGLIIMNSSTYITADTFKVKDTQCGVDYDVVELSELLEKHNAQEYSSIAMPVNMQMQFRSYDAKYNYAITRDGYLYYMNNGYYPDVEQYYFDGPLIRCVFMGIQGEEELLRQAIDAVQVDYMVVPKDFGMKEYLESIGCKNIDCTTNYEVFATR